MAGSGNDTELRHWQTLAAACQDEGCDALELNLSCPHMDRQDMGSNIGKDRELVSIVTKVVKEVARVPVWAKLTPSTTDIVVEARSVSGRRRRHLVVEHVHVAAALRRRHAGVRDQRRRPRVDRRPGRPGDSAAVAREDLGAHAGVSRQELFGNRRDLDLRARAELLPARLRHRAGLHGGHARSRDRAERDPRAESGAGALPREARGQRLDAPRRLRRPAPRPRRGPVAHPAARREEVPAATKRRQNCAVVPEDRNPRQSSR